MILNIIKSNIGNVTSENFEYFNFDLYSSETKADYNSQYSPRENIEKLLIFQEIL